MKLSTIDFVGYRNQVRPVVEVHHLQLSDIDRFSLTLMEIHLVGESNGLHSDNCCQCEVPGLKTGHNYHYQDDTLQGMLTGLK